MLWWVILQRPCPTWRVSQPSNSLHTTQQPSHMSPHWMRHMYLLPGTARNRVYPGSYRTNFLIELDICGGGCTRYMASDLYPSWWGSTGTPSFLLLRFLSTTYQVHLGSDLMLGASVCFCSWICEKRLTIKTKRKPRGLTLTGRLWFGPTRHSKSITSAVRITDCHFCYPAPRHMLPLGSPISPSTLQSPPSKSASHSY